MHHASDRRGFIDALVGDGRPALAAVALGLVLSGLFALFLALTGEFLPHDERFLGMTARELCSLHGCRIVHFMIHDRASFGGALVALGLLYLWLIRFPLAEGQAWAWQALLVTGVAGYASFFAYVGYGYFDYWHAAASLVLLAFFAAGLSRSWRLLRPASPDAGSWPTAGRVCLLGTAAGLTAGGLTVLTVGMTCVFVPEDLAFIGLPADELRALNPRLVPLIAHDRAGFGGIVCCYGVGMFFCVRHGRPSRGLWQMLALAGTAGFATGIGVHPLVGYNDPAHLAPAVLGASTYSVGLALTWRAMCRGATPGRGYLPLTLISSTSKVSSAPGGMTPAAPRSP